MKGEANGWGWGVYDAMYQDYYQRLLHRWNDLQSQPGNKHFQELREMDRKLRLWVEVSYLEYERVT